MPDSCVICKCPRSKIKYRVDSFKIVRCLNCGFVYLKNPLPLTDDTDTYDHYFQASRSHAYEKDSKSAAIRTLWTINDQRLDLIDRVGGIKSILDLGSGRGHFLYHASGRGYDVRGVEVSAIAAQYCEHHYHVETSLANIETENWGMEGAIDLITMWHILEHVSDPVALLRKARSALTPGGYVMLEVPNLNSLKFRLASADNKWVGGNHPRHHRLFFTHRTLKKLLEQVGFHNIKFVKTTYNIPDKGIGVLLLKRILKRSHMDSFLTVIARQ